MRQTSNKQVWKTLPSAVSHFPFNFKYTFFIKKVLLVSVHPTSCTVGFLFPPTWKKKKKQTDCSEYSLLLPDCLSQWNYAEKVATFIGALSARFSCEVGGINGGGVGAVTNVNAPDITCNHWDIHLRTNSSLCHHLNDLSCSERLKKISVIGHLRTAGRKCQPRGKLNLIAICSYKENQGI